MVGVRRVMGKKSFRDWKDLNDNWGKAGERNMDRKVKVVRFMIDSKNLFIGQYDKLFEEYWLSPISYLSPYRG